MGPFDHHHDAVAVAVAVAEAAESTSSDSLTRSGSPDGPLLASQFSSDVSMTDDDTVGFELSETCCMDGDDLCPEHAAALLRTQPSVVVPVDLRTQARYNQQHLTSALTVSSSSMMQRRLERGTVQFEELVPVSDRPRFCRNLEQQGWFLLYDDSCADTGPKSTLRRSFDALRRLSPCPSRVRFLRHGLAPFAPRCPDLVVCNVPKPQPLSFTLPARMPCAADSVSAACPSSAISRVTPFLFVGNRQDSEDLALLKSCNIRYVLNVTADLPNCFEADPSFKYHRIAVTDSWHQNLGSFFAESNAFIEQAIREGAGVLVHCLAGISRSATFAIAFLMWHKRISMADAYDTVKAARSIVSPNLDFMGALLAYEKELFGSCHSDSTRAPHSLERLLGLAGSKSSHDCDSDPEPLVRCLAVPDAADGHAFHNHYTHMPSSASSTTSSSSAAAHLPLHHRHPHHLNHYQQPQHQHQHQQHHMDVELDTRLDRSVGSCGEESLQSRPWLSWSTAPAAFAPQLHPVGSTPQLF